MKRLSQPNTIRTLVVCLLMLTASTCLAQSSKLRRTEPVRSLLNEGGRFDTLPSAAQVASWRRAVSNPALARSQRAKFHLWLGEWELGVHEEPTQALKHFRLARRYSDSQSSAHGISAFDTALTLFRQGAYADCAQAFHQLIQPRVRLHGYDAHAAALWYRHAAACAAYHQSNAKAGIPQPSRLDPLCGIAGLAECLRTYGKPFDKQTLLKHCRVTGFGNSTTDLAKTASYFGMAAHTVSADEQGLRLLPKPLIAHVEGDHFVTVLDVNAKGIVYQCADCGPWPGGRVHLTWKQWRRMNPGVYQVIVPKRSPLDIALTQISHSKSQGEVALRPSQTLLAGFGTPQAISIPVPPISVLMSHVLVYNGPTFSCGLMPDSPRCPPETDCPEDDPENDDGPSCGDPVNLANGEEAYTPPADLTVYNPKGPAVQWRRIYNTLRVSYNTFYEYNDFGSGWSHGYNILLYVSSNQIILIFPDGSRYAFDASQKPTAAMPSVDCLCTSTGVPMFVRWQLTSTGNQFTVWHADRSQWIFSSRNHSLDTNPCYSLEAILDPNEKGLHFIYQGYGPAAPRNSAGYPLLAAILDDNSQPLLTIARTRDGKFNIASISDRYGRSIYYRHANYPVTNEPAAYPQSQQKLIEVSQIAPTGAFRPAFRYRYGYTDMAYAGARFPNLHTITVPSPIGTGTSTLTLNYNGIFIGSIVDGNGNSRTYSVVNSQRTKVTIKDAQGNVDHTYSVEFDAQSREIARFVGENNVLLRRVQYSSANQIRPDSVTDGNGKITSFQWDQFGNVQRTVSPRGTVTVYTRSYGAYPLGELRKVQEIAADGTRKTPTTFTYYQPSGLLKTIQSPLPGSTDGTSTVLTEFTYDKYGSVLTVSTPGNNAVSSQVTTFFYIPNGEASKFSGVNRPLTVTDNLGKVTRFRYDSRGNLIRVTDALGYSTAFAYNLADQQVQADLPYDSSAGSQPSWRTVMTYGYLYPGGPQLSAQTWQTPKNGGSATLFRQVLYTYGAEGELRTVRGSTEPATYGYDGLYRLQTLADGRTQTTTYAYNGEGYLASVRYPNGDLMQYPLYDPMGNPLRRIDGRGIVTNLVYDDPENRLTDVQYQNHAQFPNIAALNIHLTYDGFGRRATMLDGACYSTYAYDDRDRLTTTVTSFKSAPNSFLPDKIIGYDYYPDGSRRRMTTPAGIFTYQYDPVGRMTNLVNPAQNDFGWTYRDNGWLETQRLSGAATTAYSYASGYGWLTTLTTRRMDVAQTVLSQFSNLQYDPASNLTSVTASVSMPAGVPNRPYDGVTTYGYASHTANIYDSKNELRQEQSTRAGGYTHTFRYDDAGNPTTFRGTDPTATLGYNSANQNKAFVHDGNGNPTTYKGATLAFDPENHLTAYGNALTAGYYGSGLRAWKQTAQGRTYFLYDGISPVCELDAAGNVTAINTFGANGLLSRQTASSNVFYTFDMQGSTAQRINVSGTILSVHSFDAFGTPNTAPSDPFNYGAQWGYYTDSETNLHLCGFRYYDATTGRFLNRDPIGSAGGINIYSYVNANPLKFIDSHGTAPLTPGDIFSPNGGLTDSAIANSRQIRSKLGNPALPKGIAKFSTQSFYPSSAYWRQWQVHFYRNIQTGAAYYGLDYKSVIAGKGSDTFARRLLGTSGAVSTRFAMRLGAYGTLWDLGNMLGEDVFYPGFRAGMDEFYQGGYQGWLDDVLDWWDPPTPNPDSGDCN